MGLFLIVVGVGMIPLSMWLKRVQFESASWVPPHQGEEVPPSIRYWNANVIPFVRYLMLGGLRWFFLIGGIFIQIHVAARILLFGEYRWD